LQTGVTEYQLKAAAAGVILEGGGDLDFGIIGSTPMKNPALIFGNPRGPPAARSKTATSSSWSLPRVTVATARRSARRSVSANRATLLR